MFLLSPIRPILLCTRISEAPHCWRQIGFGGDHFDPKSLYTSAPCRPTGPAAFHSWHTYAGYLNKTSLRFSIRTFGPISTEDTNARRRPKGQMERNLRTYRTTRAICKRPIPTPNANQQFGLRKPPRKPKATRGIRRKTQPGSNRQGAGEMGRSGRGRRYRNPSAGGACIRVGRPPRESTYVAACSNVQPRSKSLLIPRCARCSLMYLRIELYGAIS